MKAWEKSNSKLKRTENIYKILQNILIVCEGSRTEPNYFKMFPVNKKIVSIDIRGTGYNTISLVNKAIELKDKADKIKQSYNQVWCVFDKDSFPDNNFNNAINKALDHKIKVAYSNEAFELWYLLHFDYHNSAISRSQYYPLLSENICLLTNGKKTKYKKNDTKIYELLLDKQPTAINNAKKLNALYTDKRYSKHNPRTTVHLLVEELQKHSTQSPTIQLVSTPKTRLAQK